MNTYPTLTSLPSEMIARAVSFLSLDDCLQLRLANRHLNIFASREVGKRRFGKVSVTMTRYSLQALVGICQHPIFGDCVRNICLSGRRVDRSKLNGLLKKFQEALMGGDLENLDKIHHFLQEHIKNCYEESSLEKSGEGTRFIAAALASLKERSRPVQLAVSDDHVDTIGAWKAHRNNGFDDVVLDTRRFKTSMRVIANAAHRSGCSIQGLNISHHCGLPDCMLNADECCIELGGHVLNAFAMIKSLHIKFEYCFGQASLKSLTALLSVSKRLQELHLSLGSTPDADNRLRKKEVMVVNNLLSNGCLRSKLKAISLKEIPISQKVLIELLSNSAECLRSLELESVYLRRGTWDLVIGWIRDKLALDTLYIDQISEVDDDDLNNKGYLTKVWVILDGPIDACGEDDVRNALDWII